MEASNIRRGVWGDKLCPPSTYFVDWVREGAQASGSQPG